MINCSVGDDERLASYEKSTARHITTAYHRRRERKENNHLCSVYTKLKNMLNNSLIKLYKYV